MAAEYDLTFGLSAAGRLLRFRLAERVAAFAPPGARILDVGCGTGDDAIWLARHGHVVVGIDESSRMIEVAREKASRVRSPATFECRRLQSLPTDAARFDVVVSNFGALNCIPLSVWSEMVPRLLTPKGRAFLVLMGPRPLPAGLRHGFRGASWGAKAEARVGCSPVPVHYDSVWSVKRALGGSGRVRHVEAMGCVIPGPTYAGWSRRNPLGIGPLSMAEGLTRTLPFFRDRGDHTLFEFTAR